MVEMINRREAEAVVITRLDRGFRSASNCLELVAKPHKHFFNVIMTQANWKKATNILI